MCLYRKHVWAPVSQYASMLHKPLMQPNVLAGERITTNIWCPQLQQQQLISNTTSM